MGAAREPKPAKYFAALLSSDEKLLSDIENDLVSLGSIDLRSVVFPWTFSNFYENEMGTGLLRRFVSFASPRSPDELAAVKNLTQHIESAHRDAESGRRINIDPGYLDAYKVVLASTKNANQRIYLRDGIYAEATLMFHDAAFHGLPYTYRDYLWPETLSFFAELRACYLAQLRQLA